MSEKSLLIELLPWAPIIGALGGAFVTGLVAFGINLVNKKYEARRHSQELIFKSAVEEWKQHFASAIEVMKMKTGKKIEIEPLITYLVHLLKLSEVLIDGTITKQNLSQKLTEVDEVMKEVKKFTRPPKKETIEDEFVQPVTPADAQKRR